MANIEISDLNPAGSELFKDSESFMSDLIDSEVGSIQGGWRWSGWKCGLSIVASAGLGSPGIAVTVWAATTSRIKP
ncbi:hypothetical protein A6770_05660 [Nostoc minutum NIES-26]|uniref:Uncharacterized protein n=1 Tax=Nostoc minutum NIES-26 TaxID=1844469 RepID=A0A367Q642_9NOSO|nr:hypothetical protein A6770_05660 [Nostoc minutum NIES-26]